MMAPTKIGNYQIVRRIGKSMTEVYLAVDTVEGRRVALKLVPQGGDAANRMVLEAERRGAAIQKELQMADPRMIEVYEYGESDGYFFVAMQYVEGRSLAEVLRAERAVKPVRAAAIALEICEQLTKLHARRAAVVHGDIKPSNIHLGPNDTVRLLDFGIAKTLRANGDATAHQFGSPGYCPPERLERSEVDEQSDLWAVGATLYEMVAGAPPYQAENTRRLEGLIKSKRPPRALPMEVPRALRLVVGKVLAPAPGARYQTAEEMQADLQAFLEHRPTVAEGERKARAGATIEAAREALRKATATIQRARLAVHVAGGVGWFAAGMALWIGGSYGWQSVRARAALAAAPSAAVVEQATAPAALDVNEGLAGLYRVEAERVIAGHPADWHKGEILLARAVELGDGESRTAGELALSRGWAAIERLGDGQYSEAAAARLRTFERDQMALAAARLPGDARVQQGLASKALAAPVKKTAKAVRKTAPPRSPWQGGHAASGGPAVSKNQQPGHTVWPERKRWP